MSEKLGLAERLEQQVQFLTEHWGGDLNDPTQVGLRLTQEAAKAVKRQRECIQDLIYQFGVVRNGALCAGGLSVLEDAFEVMGWTEPMKAPSHLVCDEPGCGDPVGMGWSSKNGYRNTCHRHWAPDSAEAIA